MLQTPRTPRRSPLAALLLLAGVAAVAGAAVAQVPADAVLREFQPMSDYVLEVGGKLDTKAEIYQTKRSGALLILSPSFSAAVVINPRAESVETLLPAKVAKKPDGSADILADAVLRNQGTFQINGEDLSFKVDGKSAAIKARPPLLGLRKVGDLTAYSDHYAKASRNYAPAAPVIAALKAQPRDIVVRTYFGSWCSHCKQELPKLVRVEQELAGSKIRFEYYGLPERFGEEPEAKRLGIRAVPTGIVYAAGREIGRIEGGEWSTPETALRDTLSGGK